MKKISRKQLDLAIKNQINTICQLSATWGLIVKETNEDALTDRMIEDIIKKAKELEVLQETRFKIMAGEK